MCVSVRLFKAYVVHRSGNMRYVQHINNINEVTFTCELDGNLH